MKNRLLSFYPFRSNPFQIKNTHAFSLGAMVLFLMAGSLTAPLTTQAQTPTQIIAQRVKADTSDPGHQDSIKVPLSKAVPPSAPARRLPAAQSNTGGVGQPLQQGSDTTVSLAVIQPPRIIQYNPATIHSDFVMDARRASFKKYLMEKTIQETFSGPLNQNTDYKFEDACLSATQFLIKNQYSQRGFDKMFEQYYRLDGSTRLALMTAVYGIYPATYQATIKALMPYERDPKIFAIGALYEYRTDSSIQSKNNLLQQMRRQFADSYQNTILLELTKYLQGHRNLAQAPTPPIKELFSYQQLWKQKTVYSFQRWDRNYSGLCIVQYEDGSFARDSTTGKLKIFRQLARSGSGLPAFITNGNTPQGVYRIAGSRVSIDKLIGPTPTLQSILPFQSDQVFFRELPYDSTTDPLTNYKRLLPPSWQSYPPMQESFYAGKAGRSYIVIHGSTLDGEFFEGWPFYPNSPTDGCLSTLESWDGNSGGLIHSDQLDLVNTYHKTLSNLGLLEVINLDNQKKNVSVEEVEALVAGFEKAKGISRK